MTVLTLVFIGLALALWLQAERFDNTPSYATLLQIFPQYVWALIYFFAAILNGLGVRCSSRVLLIVAHTFSIGLLAAWWLAFVIRWVTDTHGTTPVNVLSWGVFMYVAIRSARLIDSHPRSG